MKIKVAGGRYRLVPPAPPWWTGFITPVHYWDARAAATATPTDQVGSADMTVAAGTPMYSTTGWGVDGLPAVDQDTAGDVLVADTAFFTTTQAYTISITFRNGGTPNTWIWSLCDSNSASYVGLQSHTTQWRYTGNDVTGALVWGAIDNARHVVTVSVDATGQNVVVYQDGIKQSLGSAISAPRSTNLNRFVLAALLRTTPGVVAGAQTIQWGDAIVGEYVPDDGSLEAFHRAHLAQWPLEDVWFGGLATPLHYWDARASTRNAPIDRLSKTGDSDMEVFSGGYTYNASGWGVGGLPTVETNSGSDRLRATNCKGATPLVFSMAYIVPSVANNGRVLTLNTGSNGAFAVDDYAYRQLAATSEYGFIAASNPPGSSTPWGTLTAGARTVVTAALYADGTATVYQDGSRVLNADTWNVSGLSFPVVVLGGRADVSDGINQCRVNLGDLLIAEALPDTGPLQALHAAHLAEWPLS